MPPTWPRSWCSCRLLVSASRSCSPACTRAGRGQGPQAERAEPLQAPAAGARSGSRQGRQEVGKHRQAGISGGSRGRRLRTTMACSRAFRPATSAADMGPASKPGRASTCVWRGGRRGAGSRSLVSAYRARCPVLRSSQVARHSLRRQPCPAAADTGKRSARTNLRQAAWGGRGWAGHAVDPDPFALLGLRQRLCREGQQGRGKPASQGSQPVKSSHSRAGRARGSRQEAPSCSRAGPPAASASAPAATPETTLAFSPMRPRRAPCACSRAAAASAGCTPATRGAAKAPVSTAAV